MCNQQFKQKNVLNSLDLSQSIYKYIPLKFVLSMIRNHELVMNKVSAWDDVYENFLFKEPYRLNDGTKVSAENLGNCSYGQSWTKNEESDAMWRIYSSDLKKNPCIDDIAIKVRTKAGKLFDVIYTNEACMANTYIGNVCYMDTPEINDWVKQQPYGASNLQYVFIDSLFIKRTPFAHESEVRAIVFNDTDHCSENILKFKIEDISAFLEEYVLDPRLSQTDVADITNRLIGVGVDKHKIQKSALYDFQPLEEPIILP